MRTRRAFTLIEAAIAVAIVAVALTATLTAVGSSRVSQYRAARLRQAHGLGEALMAEIRLQPYEEVGGTGMIGPDVGETLGTREQFDDVDDYHGWVGSPAQQRDGTPLPTFGRYGRRVMVEWISAPGQTVPFDTGIKYITVAVDLDGNEIVSLVSARSRGRDTLEAR